MQLQFTTKKEFETVFLISKKQLLEFDEIIQFLIKILEFQLEDSIIEITFNMNNDTYIKFRTFNDALSNPNFQYYDPYKITVLLLNNNQTIFSLEINRNKNTINFEFNSNNYKNYNIAYNKVLEWVKQIKMIELFDIIDRLRTALILFNGLIVLLFVIDDIESKQINCLTIKLIIAELIILLFPRSTIEFEKKKLSYKFYKCFNWLNFVRIIKQYFIPTN